MNNSNNLTNELDQLNLKSLTCHVALREHSVRTVVEAGVRNARQTGAVLSAGVGMIKRVALHTN